MKEFQTHGMMILTSGSIGSALALTLNNNNNLKGEEEKEEEEEGGKKKGHVEIEYFWSRFRTRSE